MTSAKPITLSICVTLKNRSRVPIDGRNLELFPRCVESIAASLGPCNDVELVVSDYGSSDWPVAEWLSRAAGTIPVLIEPVAGAFSRGRGRNAAAARARGNTLFFLDADMIVCPRVLARGRQVAAEGRALFPICWSFKDPEHREGWWRVRGYGNCVLPRGLFHRVGPWPELETWGGEDTLFHRRVASVAGVVRERVDGFVHQWHPNDRAWKNRYARR